MTTSKQPETFLDVLSTMAFWMHDHQMDPNGIEIVLPREDYFRLRHLIAKELGYTLLSLSTSPPFMYRGFKICMKGDNRLASEDLTTAEN